MMSRSFLNIALGLMVLVMGVAGCQVNPATGKNQLVFISEKEEIALGLKAAPEFEKQFDGLVADATLQEYVKRVGAKVSAESDRKIPYEFGLLRSEIPNAFALPGGKVYVTTGLMRIMENERQLASVISHEIGHVAAMHSVSQLQRQMGSSVLLEIAQMAAGEEHAQAAKTVGALTFNVVNMKFSRTQEYQADSLGIRYMARAGYNPWGSVELLKILKSLSNEEGSRLGEMFQTHPLTQKRIEEATDIVTSKYSRFSADMPDANKSEFLKMQGMLGAPVKK
ncbi:MAG: M48 family metalloprotease [Phycisphaerae bacterium]|nr:M48 family metalloprotease [Phycisphaerae bacterium]